MKNTYSFILLACLLASVFTQCPTFYSDYNQQGKSFQLCSSDNVPGAFNDQISSFVIPTGYQIRLHGDSGFSGEFWGLYDKGSFNVPASFNDKLSSVSVFRTQNINNKPRCPTFYADLDLQGDSFQLCSTANSLPSQWNDRISSFVIPEGYSIQLYADNNKGGDSRGPYTEGAYNIPSSFNDQASSVVVNNYKDNNSNNDNSPDVRCPTFYTDADQKGSKFQLCSSSNVPDGFNDKVSSFVIPAGYSVQLFPDYNNGGDQWGPYTEGVYNVASEFNDQLSSVFISRDKDSHSQSDNDNKNSNKNNNNNNSNKNNNNNQKCPTFYTRDSQQGKSFQLCSSGNVPAQWNDQALSFVVPKGYQVRLYPDANYRGKAVGPYNAGSYSVPRSFRNQLSSVAIVPLCPTFYADYNQQGDSFQLCSGSNVPQEWNDKVSSFSVPEGYSVRLYADYDYRGDSRGTYRVGSYNVPSDFNDMLSSVTIKSTA